MKSVFTSESVCAGHPDKICDQISDAIVDAALAKDPKSRVAVETLVTKNKCVLAGEVTSRYKLNYEKIARGVIKKLGYTDPKLNFTYKSPIEKYIHEQSPEIAVGVDEKGAGDQGMMYGYACRETETLMPMPIAMAHALVQRIDHVREKKIMPYLRPDGKSQVTINYENGISKSVDTVILAVPHREDVEEEQVKQDLFKKVVTPVLEKFSMKFNSTYIVNGTGVWHIGGPASDTGVTGRKIIVDTYGGMARAGGGCFLRKGSNQSRPKRSICRPLYRKKYSCRQTRRPL